jgi:hypothetical protein
MATSFRFQIPFRSRILDSILHYWHGRVLHGLATGTFETKFDIRIVRNKTPEVIDSEIHRNALWLRAARNTVESGIQPDSEIHSFPPDG